MPPPNVILKLCGFPKKSIIAFIHRSHFLEIVNAFLDLTLCLTHDSKIASRIEFAHSLGDQTFSYRHRASASISSAELQAIFQSLEHILALIPLSHTFLIVSDSLSALTAVANVHSTHPLVTRIHTICLPLSHPPPSPYHLSEFPVTEEFQAMKTLIQPPKSPPPSLASILKSSLRKPISHSSSVSK